jgi:hypothetical protein
MMKFYSRKYRMVMLAAAGLMLASVSTSALADRYKRVTIYETIQKPITVIHSPVIGSVYVGTTVYRADYGHGRHHDNRKHYREHGHHDRGYHGKGHRKHDHHRHGHGYSGHFKGHDIWRGGNYHDRHQHNARGSWATDRRRGTVYVNERGRKGSTYRQVERNSVVIRQRDR